MLKLHEWSGDAVAFMNDALWVADPRGNFGGGDMPAAIAPPRMVPVLLYPEQERIVRRLVGLISGREQAHLNLLKDRQVAATSIVLVGTVIWCWLFRPGFTALLTSYEDDVIDGGGKGHREGDTLFSRFRQMLDALVWCLPQLGFNQQRAQRWRTKQIQQGNIACFSDSEDTKGRIVRPAWPVFGHDHFAGARGNYVIGKLPSDKLGKSLSLTFAGMDEFGEYDKLGPGVDRKARTAVTACSRVVLTQGTIPDHGGLDSDFKALCDMGDGLVVNNEVLCWSDIPPYMVGAWWTCPECSHDVAWGQPSPGPKDAGLERTCDRCGSRALVRHADLSSPWFERVKEIYGHDPIALARYYRHDWYASMGDRAFYTFRKSKALVRRSEEGSEWWRTVDGFDPGWSSENPACWMMVRFSDRLLVPRVVAWHMRSERTTDWWLPFFKKWRPRSLERKLVLTGPHAGRRWLEVFDYTDEELSILERVGNLWPSEPTQRWRGDKYGSHTTGVGFSEYDVLMRYGVVMEYDYLTPGSKLDRTALLTRMRDLWVPRMEIDPALAEYRPPPVGNVKCPSIVDAFLSARMRTSGKGQGEAKRDIDKNNPRHVSHIIDAFLYATMAFPESVDVRAGPSGEALFVPSVSEEPWHWGGGEL